MFWNKRERTSLNVFYSQSCFSSTRSSCFDCYVGNKQQICWYCSLKYVWASWQISLTAGSLWTGFFCSLGLNPVGIWFSTSSITLFVHDCAWFCMFLSFTGFIGVLCRSAPENKWLLESITLRLEGPIHWRRCRLLLRECYIKKDAELGVIGPLPCCTDGS